MKSLTPFCWAWFFIAALTFLAKNPWSALNFFWASEVNLFWFSDRIPEPEATWFSCWTRCSDLEGEEDLGDMVRRSTPRQESVRPASNNGWLRVQRRVHGELRQRVRVRVPRLDRRLPVGVAEGGIAHGVAVLFCHLHGQPDVGVAHEEVPDGVVVGCQLPFTVI